MNSVFPEAAPKLLGAARRRFRSSPRGFDEVAQTELPVRRRLSHSSKRMEKHSSSRDLDTATARSFRMRKSCFTQARVCPRLASDPRRRPLMRVAASVSPPWPAVPRRWWPTRKLRDLRRFDTDLAQLPGRGRRLSADEQARTRRLQGVCGRFALRIQSAVCVRQQRAQVRSESGRLSDVNYRGRSASIILAGLG
jgi:hypothetical protein